VSTLAPFGRTVITPGTSGGHLGNFLAPFGRTVITPDTCGTNIGSILAPYGRTLITPGTCGGHLGSNWAPFGRTVITPGTLGTHSGARSWPNQEIQGCHRVQCEATNDGLALAQERSSEDLALAQGPINAGTSNMIENNLALAQGPINAATSNMIENNLALAQGQNNDSCDARWWCRGSGPVQSSVIWDQLGVTLDPFWHLTPRPLASSAQMDPSPVPIGVN